MKQFSAKKSQKCNFCSPVLWVLLIAAFLFLTGCSAKNNTIKNDLKKKIAYSLNQANKYFSSMQLEKAIQTYKETLELCYMLDDLETEVIVYVKLSSVYLVLGKEEETYFYLLKARAILALYEEQLSYYPVYLFYSGQADYYLYQKDFGQCFDFYEKSLALAETQKEKSYILNRIGRAYIVKGSPDKALDYINQSLKINQSKKYYDLLGDNYYNLAKIFFMKKEFKQAADHAEKALEYDRITENVSGVFLDLILLADIHHALGNKELEISYIQRALSLAISLNLQSSADQLKKRLSELAG